MKILFMGTPEIAAHALQSLIKTGEHEICGVFTREDKPVGRKKIMTAPPVKLIAQEHNIQVFQPKTLRNEQAFEIVEKLKADIIVVVAYGRILPPDILNLPKYGAINLHVSMLPKYRGAAPVQWAVINGEKQTGVTIMQLDEGLDTGDIISVLPIEIGENETAGQLMQKVTEVGANLLCETVRSINKGSVQAVKQNDELATHAPPLTKEMASFNFENSASILHNLIRGTNPWPMAYFMLSDKKIKVSESEVFALQESGVHEIGEILSLKPLTIACESGALILHRLIPEGAKEMQGTAFAAGKRLKIGDNLVSCQ